MSSITGVGSRSNYVTRLSAEELESQNKLREAQMAATQESNEAISAGGSTDKMEAGSASGSQKGGGLMAMLDPLGITGMLSGLLGGGKGGAGGGIASMFGGGGGAGGGIGKMLGGIIG